MRFALTPEQEALRASARRFLNEAVDVRAQIALPGAHDPALWKELGALGWLGASIPETYGGQGMPLVEQCLLVEETGRALLPGPFLPHLIASAAIARCGSEEQRAARLPALASGESIGAYADIDQSALVPGAGVADLLVARRALTLSLVRRDSFEATPAENADLTRPAAQVSIGADAEPLARPDVPGMHTRAATLVAAECVGVAQAALDMAVAYAKDREQFGAPIGTFQAIKHKCADMLRAVEAARLLAYRAALAIDHAEDDHAVSVSMAKAAANDAVLLCAKENIQIHGGIGVTWEHGAHLLYRHALAAQTLFGTASVNRDRVALALLGADGP